MDHRRAAGPAHPAAVQKAGDDSTTNEQEEESMMNIAPTPEFLEACRRVLGDTFDGSPAQVIAAMRDERLADRIRDTHTEIVRAKARRRAGKVGVGTQINVQGYTVPDRSGVTQFYWFVVPDGMTRDEACITQEHHGPFDSEREAEENQRVVLGGERVA
jgi:hypothetical protein